MSRLLPTEKFYAFPPSLAGRVGVNAALVLCELSYRSFGKSSSDGYTVWVEASNDSLRQPGCLPFVSVRTIERVFSALQTSGVLQIRAAGGSDRTRTARVNLRHPLLDDGSKVVDSSQVAKLAASQVVDSVHAAKLADSKSVDFPHAAKLAASIPPNWRDHAAKLAASLRDPAKLAASLKTPEINNKNPERSADALALKGARAAARSPEPIPGARNPEPGRFGKGGAGAPDSEFDYPPEVRRANQVKLVQAVQGLSHRDLCLNAHKDLPRIGRKFPS